MPRPIARPRKPPYDIDQAVRELSQRDPKLGRLIARAGPFTMRLASTLSPFEALLESIVYQQLHGKAAAAIHAKLIASFGEMLGDGVHPSAEHLLDAPNEQLRQAGLSHNKALAIRDLAAKTVDGTVPTLARIRRMSDEDVIAHVTQVRGIGRWTVEMFLILSARPAGYSADRRLRRPEGVRAHLWHAETGRQSIASGSASARGHGEAREEVAPLELGRELVPVAGVRSREAGNAARQADEVTVSPGERSLGPPNSVHCSSVISPAAARRVIAVSSTSLQVSRE